MVDAFNSISEKLKNNKDSLSSYHILFANVFPEFTSRNYGCNDLLPLQSKTKDLIQEIINEIEEEEETEKVLDLFYGFYDGEYYSVEDIAKKLSISIVNVFNELDTIRAKFEARKNEILKTIPEKSKNPYNH